MTRPRHIPPRRSAAISILPLVLAACALLGGVAAPGPAGARYHCHLFPFDPTVVERPGTAERADEPRAAALRGHLQRVGEPELLPDTGWHLVGSDPDIAQFVAQTDDGYASVTVELANGAWGVTGWGGCSPELVLAGDARAATWELAPDAPEPEVTSTTITVLVSERSCASGRPPGDRIVGPQVVAELSVIRIAFGVRPLPGGQDCQGSPPGRVVIDLGQPIGDRALSDFAFWPPVNVWAPSEP